MILTVSCRACNYAILNKLGNLNSSSAVKNQKKTKTSRFSDSLKFSFFNFSTDASIITAKQKMLSHALNKQTKPPQMCARFELILQHKLIAPSMHNLLHFTNQRKNCCLQTVLTARWTWKNTRFFSTWPTFCDRIFRGENRQRFSWFLRF